MSAPSRLVHAHARLLIAAAASVATMVIAYEVSIRASGTGILQAAVYGVGLAVVAYCFFAEDPGRPLVAFLLYVTLLDGYLKLATDSQLIVLGRDVLIAAIAGGMLARAIIRRETTVPPLTAAVAFYIALVLVQVAHPDATSLGHSLQALRPHVEWVPLFFVAFAYLRTAQRLRAMFTLLVVVTAINGAVALVQYQLTPEQLASWGPGYSERLFGGGDVAGRTALDASSGEVKVRPFGLGSDVGFGGALAVIAAPGALALLALRRRQVSRLLAALSAAGIVTALVTSQARITLVLAGIAVIAFLALSSLARRRARVVAGLLVGLAISWVAVSWISANTDTGVFDRYESITPTRVVGTAFDYKADTFRLTVDYLDDIPLGAGLGNVGPASGGVRADGPRYDGESEFNFLLVELGIPGLILVLGLAVSLCALAFARIPRIEDDEARVLLAALGAGAVAATLGFAGAPVTAGVPLGPYLWLTAGIFAFWLIEQPRQERRRQAQAAGAVSLGPAATDPR